MPTKKVRRRIPRVVAVVPVSTRLSRMEDLLIEMRGEQDVKLKKLNMLRQQVDELTETVKRMLKSARASRS
jgi:hypothetical protein